MISFVISSVNISILAIKIERAQQGLRRGSDYVGFGASSITGSDAGSELDSVNGSSFFQLS